MFTEGHKNQVVKAFVDYDITEAAAVYGLASQGWVGD